MKRAFVFGMVALLAAGCGMLRDDPPTVTPILVTATNAPPPIIPIVATETPTPVLKPTDLSMLPTMAASRTPTPPPPAPITMTPSFTPSPTDTPVTPGAVFGPVGGAPGAAGGSACANVPPGGFGAIFQVDPGIQTAIGCPLASAAAVSDNAYQPFQNGLMIWIASIGGSQPVIYALFNNGTYQRFNDTFREGVDPNSSGAVAPEGMQEPVRGFGKVWRDNPGVRDTLGWASAGESPGSAQVQLFERGEMVYVSQAGQIYILITGAPGTWSARAGSP
jgi:hypothetical protein